ncbi:MAG: type II toxin-antitoxin system Phd/YefM family antitoxin [Syntrophomonadaceae bacterium]|jgi:PHD/YefM family antitoxin component YafN of YafNO toxin-antitoxin module
MSLAMSDYDDPVLFGPAQLVTSSKLSKNLGEYLNKTEKRPIFIQRDNNVEAVLLNIDEYRALLLEERKVEDLYDAVVAVRRLLESVKNHTEFLDNQEVMKSFGITEEMLVEGE